MLFKIVEGNCIELSFEYIDIVAEIQDNDFADDIPSI